MMEVGGYEGYEGGMRGTKVQGGYKGGMRR